MEKCDFLSFCHHNYSSVLYYFPVVYVEKYRDLEGPLKLLEMTPFDRWCVFCTVSDIFNLE